MPRVTLAALVAPDFRWLSVDGDEVRVEAEGREALRSGMVEYFTAYPDVTTDLELANAGSPYLSVRERVRWTGADGTPQAQASLSVYEVRGESIRRVWYFPAEP